MNNQYLVEYSQRFDQLVYAVYGTLALFEDMLAANTHLLDKMYLDPGDTVILIDVPADEQIILTEENPKALW